VGGRVRGYPAKGAAGGTGKDGRQADDPQSGHHIHRAVDEAKAGVREVRVAAKIEGAPAATTIAVAVARRRRLGVNPRVLGSGHCYSHSGHPPPPIDLRVGQHKVRHVRPPLPARQLHERDPRAPRPHWTGKWGLKRHLWHFTLEFSVFLCNAEWS